VLLEDLELAARPSRADGLDERGRRVLDKALEPVANARGTQCLLQRLRIAPADEVQQPGERLAGGLRRLLPSALFQGYGRQAQHLKRPQPR
ncbi:MAG: hypothetical protein K0R40_2958, partial [Burkholderiales bacterium]|nr:hypothetical protein [Burkholderiales bacterium]